MAAKLHLAAPGEQKPKPRKLTITQAAAGGTLREQLAALRDRVAKTVEDVNCPARELASLSRRLMEITKEIAAIDAIEAEAGDDSHETPDDKWAAV